jgi:hypothetical protein
VLAVFAIYFDGYAVRCWLFFPAHFVFLLNRATVMKDEVVPVHAMQAYGGRSGVAPLILNLGTRWKWVANLTLQPPSSPGDNLVAH